MHELWSKHGWLFQHFQHENKLQYLKLKQCNQSANCCYHRKVVIWLSGPLKRNRKQTSLAKTIIAVKIRVVFLSIMAIHRNKLAN